MILREGSVNSFLYTVMDNAGASNGVGFLCLDKREVCGGSLSL